MRTCPQCRTACDDGLDACPVDGAPLRPPDPLLGQVLGERYRVVAVLGAGGMGTVYRAEHVVLRKRMAVKVLRPELSRDEDLVRRFQQEAIAASQIGQENIVDVTDFGRTPDGAVYYVMEELDGATLATLLDAGPLPVGRAVVLLTQIARALGAAHGRGIVHRDLKPDNVVVVRRDDGDFVKVLDFGIAKTTSSERGRVTRAGTIIGTPEYMAPEQGAAMTVDHRADVYALGVLAYEMLTGEVPFGGPTPLATMIEHQTRAPVPPRQRRAEIPEALEHIVLWAMAKRPEGRPQSMGEILDALEPVRRELGMPAWADRAPTIPPGSGTAAGATRRRPTTGRGATLELDLTPVDAAPPAVPVAPSLDRVATADAPRRGRIAVAAVLTAAIVVAAVAAATWRWTAPPQAPPASAATQR